MNVFILFFLNMQRENRMREEMRDSEGCETGAIVPAPVKKIKKK
jgi:hypothetical protein